MLPPLLEPELGHALITAYRRGLHPDVRLAWCDADGGHRGGDDPELTDAAFRALVIRQAFDHGEGIVLQSADGSFAWAAALCCNQQLHGGLIAWLPEQVLFPEQADGAAIDMRAACRELRRLLEAHNLCNAALMAERRRSDRHEQRRADGIHAAKRSRHRDLISAYLDREPALLAAVRAGRREQARGLLNEVLVAYYHHGAGAIELLRSLLLELFILLCRSATEAGAGLSRIAELRLQAITELEVCTDEETIAAWLSRSCERLFDLLEAGRQGADEQLARDLQHLLTEYCHDEDLDREAIAAGLGISPSALSRLCKRQFQAGFAELLAQVRIDQACALIDAGEDNLLTIALQVGFKDPSWFTKVFRKHRGLTPRAYRKLQRAGES